MRAFEPVDWCSVRVRGEGGRPVPGHILVFGGRTGKKALIGGRVVFFLLQIRVNAHA